MGKNVSSIVFFLLCNDYFVFFSKHDLVAVKNVLDDILFDLDLVGFTSSSDRFWILSECWVNPWRLDYRVLMPVNMKFDKSPRKKESRNRWANR